jgi:hypothetical protein
MDCKDNVECSNSGSNSDNINGTNDVTKNKSINQQNLCIIDAKCSNNGSTNSDEDNDNNSQSNICVP